MYSLYKPMYDPRGGAIFGPRAFNLNKLGTGPLADATYQISKL